MALDPNWEISPGRGLGQLTFLSSPEADTALDEVYGQVQSRNTSGVSEDVINETLALLGDSLSEEDRATVIEGLRAQGGENEILTEVRTGKGVVIVLDYKKNEGLHTITISEDESVTHFRGEYPFSLDALGSLQLFERANHEPGRYRSTGAFFDNLAIWVDGFSDASASGSIRFLGDGDQRFQSRSISMGKTAYLDDAGQSQFVQKSVL